MLFIIIFFLLFPLSFNCSLIFCLTALIRNYYRSVHNDQLLVAKKNVVSAPLSVREQCWCCRCRRRLEKQSTNNKKTFQMSRMRHPHHRLPVFQFRRISPLVRLGSESHRTELRDKKMYLFCHRRHQTMFAVCMSGAMRPLPLDSGCDCWRSAIIILIKRFFSSLFKPIVAALIKN